VLSLCDAIGASPFRVGDLLDLPARCYPEKPAIESACATLSFRELALRVSTVQQSFLERGAGRRQRWGLVIKDEIKFIEAFLALQRLGCVVVPFRISSEPHLRLTIKIANLHNIVCESTGAAANLLKSVGNQEKDVPFEGLSLYCLKKNDQSYGHDPIDVDPAVILLTSGTTSHPKAVVLQHHAIIANIRSNVSSLGFRDSDRTLLALPLHHAYGLIHQCLCHLAIGSTICTGPKPLLSMSLNRAMRENGITTIATTPPLLAMLLEGISRDHGPPSALRLVTVGTARVSEQTVSRCLQLLPNAQLVLTYGLTEAGPRVASQFVESGSFDCSWVGNPIPNTEVHLRVNSNQESEIVVRSRSIMEFYYDGSELAGDRFTLRTGDRGRLSNERILLEGRSDRVINVGGVRLNADQIEGLLKAHPSVADAQVLKQPHEFWGEIPMVKIVPIGPPSLTLAAEIKIFAINNLGAGCSHLRISFTSSLDLLNSSGKGAMQS
jgi:long-chain acyl-CoA synthetase